MSESLTVAGLEFEVRRSARRKTLGLTVGRASELILHAPETTERNTLETWTRRKLLWVHRKLALKRESAPRESQPEFVSGQVIHFLGRSHRLRVKAKQPVPLLFTGDEFHLDQEHRNHAEELFRQWFTRQGVDWLSQRVEFWSRRVGESPKTIVVGNLGFRWGSCSKNGRLNFNWRVLQLPVGLADYVVVHEMIHLRERHHGPDFWGQFARIMPDYRKRQDQIRLLARDNLAFGMIASISKGRKS